jgi:hypothetical protein
MDAILIAALTADLPPQQFIANFYKAAMLVRDEDLFPVLYKRTKNGNIAWYAVSVIYGECDASSNPYSATVKATKASGIHHSPQQDGWVFTNGVNIGKKNETSYAAQAFFHAESLFRRLKDKGYKEGLPDADLVHNTDADGDSKPMLAQNFNPDKVEYPLLAQPKLNGVRCKLTVHGDAGPATLKSRGGKWYNVPSHIIKAADKFLPPGIYDGELYHDGWSLQRITSAIKKLNDDTKEIHFVCYDLVDTVLSFKERYATVQSIFGSLHQTEEQRDNPLWLCHTQEVRYKEMVYDFLGRCEEEGYEGVMLRDPNSLYQPGFRSKGLLKLKNMQDAEFKIISVKSANGRHAGCAVFKCLNDDGTENTFDVAPEGTLEYKRELYDDRENLIGKMLTVRFQERSEKNIPIFPVGVVVRDYE